MALCGACNEGQLITEEGGLVCPLCGYYEEEIQLDSTTIAPRGGNIYEPSNFIRTTKGHRLPGQMNTDTRFDIHLVRSRRPSIPMEPLTDHLAAPRKTRDRFYCGTGRTTQQGESIHTVRACHAFP